MKYLLFERIAIAIAIIAFAVTPSVYFVGYVILALMPELDVEAFTAIATVVIAFVSTIIGGCALWLSMRADKRNEKLARLSDKRKERQARLLNERNEKQARLSVQPYLHFKNVDGEDEQNPSIRNFKIVISNKGIGPAFIKSFTMLFDGKIIKSEYYYNFFKEKLQEFENPIAYQLASGSAIKAGEEIVLIGFDYTSHKEKNDFINKLELHIEYQSIYKDKTVPLSAKFGSGFNFQETDTESNFISEEMALIHEDCFAKHDRWSEQVFAKYLKDPKIVFVIQSPDSPNSYGFALGQHLDDEQTELLTLAVLSHEQGKGRGYDLLNEFIAGVKKQGRKSIFLEVAKNNAPALHLYKKAGFKRVGLRPAYYKVPNAPNIDAILMRLDIKTP